MGERIDSIKCRFFRYVHKRLTFEDMALMARALDVPVRSLVALHPSFHLCEEGDRVTP